MMKFPKVAWKVLQQVYSFYKLELLSIVGFKTYLKYNHNSLLFLRYSKQKIVIKAIDIVKKIYYKKLEEII